MGRVRVPEQMVAYVMGSAKRTRDGRPNDMRKIARIEEAEKKRTVQSNGNKNEKPLRKRPKAKVYKLNEQEQEEMNRACRKGYVTLDGTGYRRGRNSNELACAHRQWCDEHETPQIVLCKASGGRPLDNIIVDLSPLRLESEFIDNFLIQIKAQIMTAATNAGMILRGDYVEDNCEALSTYMEDEYDARENCVTDYDMEYVLTVTESDSWLTLPIGKLPVLSMGVFEGERSNAKAMARELAHLWHIPDEPPEAELEKVSRNKRKGRDCRRRGRENSVERFF